MPRTKVKKKSAETLRKMSEASKRRWADPKYRARLSKSQKRSWQDPEIRRSRVEPRVGQKRSAETRKKMSESRRKRRGGHTDPKLIERMNEARRGSHNTPEQNKKISKAKKQWHEDHPELSQKLITEATKANRYFDNKLELALASILDELGVRYVKQGRIDALPKPHRHHKWDFLIGTAEVAIEVDGCYWHGCEEHHPDRVDAVRRRKELLRDAEARRVGWIVIRFWEHELGDGVGVVSAVMGAIGSRMGALMSA